MNKTVIIIPTINVPVILKDLCKNIVKYQHKVSILVIGDLKTPPETKGYCEKMADGFKIDIQYLGIKEQERTLDKKILDLFTYNTPDRTILGSVLAYLGGCERIIALDDDNFPTDYDFVGFHSITGTDIEVNLIKNDFGWFNIHNALVEANDIPFYPRGFPWGKRNTESQKKNFNIEKRRVVVNQGLVLEDPDIDAISRLFHPICAVKMRDEFGYQFGLYPGVWSPFNYQNTCLERDLIPLYYRPLSAKRNADIWTAYLINRLAEHFEDVITFGQPLVKQVRNKHDLWEDLDTELINNRETDLFIEILRSIDLRENTYFKAFGELLNKAQQKINKQGMIKSFFEEYQVWYKTATKWIQK